MQDVCADRQSVQAAYFANADQSAIEGQYMVGGQIALREMGIGGIPSATLKMPAQAPAARCTRPGFITCGHGGCALPSGAEKLYHRHKSKSFEVSNGAWDIDNVEASTQTLFAMGEGLERPEGVQLQADVRSLFLDIYGALARHHRNHHGTTERQIAAVAAKNHQYSTANPLSQYRSSMTTENVLAARMISRPLTLPMCAPIIAVLVLAFELLVSVNQSIFGATVAFCMK